MSHVPAELKYVDTHEWLRLEDDGTITIGITDHAQALLGDIVFVELPQLGAQLAAGDTAGVVESVKAASDVYAPIAGEVVAINEALVNEPELANTEPYGDAWFFRVRPADADALAGALDAAGYVDLIGA
ncbi:glycine cleavage system H protein [Andreprevotia lacus DSM 23236]|jgi:glycine cleavage system H protein|uniref:Glycine cleavage system H protein n=1 Tax=Andreprevotia lacus DSM 23236 TaxID=1121001 RepID=A0A1W1XBS9_9NEIS|nr:glycine cleavage system protein GcvH [Andreprevotia lacus]SMC21323.1 glycine cleavage system H protein [Andreprevotia lacus DSM 23236]